MTNNNGFGDDLPVGEILRRERLHYGQSIPDIEFALHIRATQIQAIEDGHFHLLPGRVYATGFIRTYSEYLGLDGDKMVSLFKTQSGIAPSRPELQFPVPASESRMPQTWLIGGSLLAAFVMLGLLWGLAHRDRSIVNNVPPVPAGIRADSQTVANNAEANTPAGPAIPENLKQAQAGAAAPAADTAAAAAPAVTQTAAATAPAAAATEDRSNGIILKIVENSWVEIKDSTGKAVVSRVLNAGDKYFVPARPDLFMSLGNSGGVKLEIDGRELSSLGGDGEVLRNIPLDINVLKKKFSASARAPVSNLGNR